MQWRRNDRATKFKSWMPRSLNAIGSMTLKDSQAYSYPSRPKWHHIICDEVVNLGNVLAICHIYICLQDEVFVMDKISPISLVWWLSMQWMDMVIEWCPWDCGLLQKHVLVMVFNSFRMRNFYVKILQMRVKKHSLVRWRILPITVPLGEKRTLGKVPKISC